MRVNRGNFMLVRNTAFSVFVLNGRVEVLETILRFNEVKLQLTDKDSLLIPDPWLAKSDERLSPWRSDSQLSDAEVDFGSSP